MSLLFTIFWLLLYTKIWVPYFLWALGVRPARASPAYQSFHFFNILLLNHLSNINFLGEQSRLYLGLGRDGLLPAIFAKVHPFRHTPIHSQIWVGIVACVLAGLLNVTLLSHILSVGSLVSWLSVPSLPR